MSERLLILGASVRAAAHSARLAGFSPIAADLYRDRDLLACCPATRVEDYPAGLEVIAAQSPRAAWIYTGGLENHPQLVDSIAACRTVYGNAGGVLRSVRNPFLVAAALKDAGLLGADVRSAAPGREAGQWLRKPWASCGGGGIQWADADGMPDAEQGDRVSAGRQVPRRSSRGERYGEGERARWLHQRWIEGESRGAVYLAAAGRARLIGVTRQLVGEAWTGASAFGYAGAIGPLPLGSARRETYARIGDCLASCFDLAGLFGVDVIENSEGVWPVEVNPRYTASVEILERGLGFRLLAEHVAACRAARLPAPRTPWGRHVCGKAVVYARRPTVLSCDLGSGATLSPRRPTRFWIADRPGRGTCVEVGRPVCTVLAAGGTAEAVGRRLRQGVRRVQAWLGC